jgi:hypothetical protein
LPAGAFDDLIARAKEVDMAKVHAEIASEEQGKA